MNTVLSSFETSIQLREFQAGICVFGSLISIIKMQKVGQGRLFGNVRSGLRLLIRTTLAIISGSLFVVAVDLLDIDRPVLSFTTVQLIVLLDLLLTVQAAAGCKRWQVGRSPDETESGIALIGER